ncbi:hypothetical protein CRYUN_Cryun23aG0074500 [Craigia yunnanensis]
MDRDGQRGSTTPSAMLASLLSRRAKLQEELRYIERQVYYMETSFLQDPSQCGNVLKGFEGFLSSSKNTALLKRSREFQPEDRLFSLSSVTSPAAEEIAAGRDADGRSEYSAGQSKGGGYFANGQILKCTFMPAWIFQLNSTQTGKVSSPADLRYRQDLLFPGRLIEDAGNVKVGRALHKVVKPSKLQEWKEIFPEEKFVLSQENKWTDMLLEHNATVEDALIGWLVAAHGASMEKFFHDPSANVLQDAYDKMNRQKIYIAKTEQEQGSRPLMHFTNRIAFV